MSETSSIENEERSRGRLTLSCIGLDECAIMKELEAFLEDYASRPIDQRTGGSLTLTDVIITRRMIALLRPLLCNEASLSLHDNADNMEAFLGSTAKNKPTVFSTVLIWDCSFFSQDNDVDNNNNNNNNNDNDNDDDDDATSPDCDFFSRDDATMPYNEDVCTPDDKLCFLSAISRCSKWLTILDSPEISSGLLNTAEIENLEVEKLCITQSTQLTESEYIRLSSIIRRSVKLTDLSLWQFFLDVPQEFCNSVANAIHLQSLSLQTFCHDQVDTFFAKMISNEDGNGALECLLRNPKTQLKDLELRNTFLQDHHVMVLAQLLPSSHLETISLSGNNIQPPGFLEVARQLPKMHSLTFFFLLNNPWQHSLTMETREECGAALLHGLIENPSIENMGDNCPKYFPQCSLLWHYLCLNSAGRRLLTSSQGQPIPDALWPHILSRAGGGNPEFHDGEWGPTCIHIYDENEKLKYNGEANAVYFFLQNCSKLLSWR